MSAFIILHNPQKDIRPGTSIVGEAYLNVKSSAAELFLHSRPGSFIASPFQGIGGAVLNIPYTSLNAFFEIEFFTPRGLLSFSSFTQISCHRQIAFTTPCPSALNTSHLVSLVGARDLYNLIRPSCMLPLFVISVDIPV